MLNFDNARTRHDQKIADNVNTARNIFREIQVKLGDNLNYQTVSQALTSRNLTENQASSVICQLTQYNTGHNSGANNKYFNASSEMSSLTLESPHTSQESSEASSPTSNIDLSTLTDQELIKCYEIFQNAYVERCRLVNTSQRFYSAPKAEHQEKNLSYQHSFK